MHWNTPFMVMVVVWNFTYRPRATHHNFSTFPGGTYKRIKLKPLCKCPYWTRFHVEISFDGFASVDNSARILLRTFLWFLSISLKSKSSVWWISTLNSARNHWSKSHSDNFSSSDNVICNMTTSYSDASYRFKYWVEQLEAMRGCPQQRIHHC